MKYFLFLIASLVLSLCKKEDANMPRKQLLLGCWMHDLEASAGNDYLIYKRCESKEWPPARFRHYIKLQADGIVTNLNLAPNDAHFESLGKWTLEDKLLILSHDENGDKTSYEVVEISDSTLSLKVNK